MKLERVDYDGVEWLVCNGVDAVTSRWRAIGEAAEHTITAHVIYSRRHGWWNVVVSRGESLHFVEPCMVKIGFGTVDLAKAEAEAMARDLVGLMQEGQEP